MKKLLLAAIIISATSFAATGSLVDNVTVFGGVNLNGEMKSGDSKEDVKVGYTAGVEAHKQMVKFVGGKFELGMGTKYDSTITTKEDGEEFEYASTMPVYGSAKLSYQLNKTTNFYLQGKAGYAFAFDGDTVKDYDNVLAIDGGNAEVEGGMYTGLGLGVEVGNYTVGLAYDVTKATLKVEDPTDENSEEDCDYSKLALTVGYKFDTK